MQVRGAGARVDNAAHVDMAEAAPESLQMERQEIRDFPGRLDATQLEGCWFNPCCCQGYRPTGPDLEIPNSLYRSVKPRAERTDTEPGVSYRRLTFRK